MRKQINVIQQLDWVTVLLFYILILLGWLNIYASVYDESVQSSILDFTQNSGRQLIFISGTILLIILIMALDFRFYDTFAYLLYAVAIILLVAVLLFAREINGAKSWIEIGAFRLQPSEMAKFATALAIAKYMSQQSFKIEKINNQLIAAAIFTLPAGLTVLQGDLGTAIVFSAFILVLFREGMSPIPLVLSLILAAISILTLLNQTYLLIGIGLLTVLTSLIAGRKNFRRIAIIIGVGISAVLTTLSVQFAFNNFLKAHHQDRIMVLLNPNVDPLGAGWNVTQSKIAIGSGGLSGRGFLKGTQTKFDFVPEQSTDFIFCTIGEEHGWIGSLVLIVLFITLLFRIIGIAERQKEKFTRIYGYAVAAILFFHFTINIGMTIGLFPVIGIPLPFFSYGGSSLLSFTILLFILLKLDAHRAQMLAR